MSEYRTCPRCRGTGWEDEWDQIPCDECWGDGEILVQETEENSISQVSS